MIRASRDGTARNLPAGIGMSLVLSLQLLALCVVPAAAAPKAEPWSYWAANDPAGMVRVDHGARGVRMEGDRFYLSSIYDWFQADFGGSEEGVLRHLRRYAAPDVVGRLKGFPGKTAYEYDWRINEP